MSNIIRNVDRNRAIQELMTDGEKLKAFYRFVANNPHIPLHDACQIVIERPSASVCFSFEEWNAQDRRVTKGRKGIPYYDGDGNKYFVFDVADTHGENRYRRITQPVKKILDGLDLLNGTEIAESNRGDYRIILSGVVTYLGQNEFLTENDEIRNRLIAEGVAYSLYSTTGLPKERGINLKGYPYGLNDNADLFREVLQAAEVLQQDINDAVFNKQNEVPVIDDTEEEYVTDEPVFPKSEEQSIKTEEKTETPNISPIYAKYTEVQKDNPDSIVVYRLGDFYEIMGEKAKQTAEILDLTLTGRDVGLSERVPMCGYPYHVADKYTEKLLETTSVVVIEPDKEPFKIVSPTNERKTIELTELSPEESEEFDNIFLEETDEQDEILDDYIDEAPTEEEIAETFEEIEYDAETEDYDYEERKQSKKSEKSENKGKRMFERRNRPLMQKSLFDIIETKSAEEELTEQILKGGSRVSGGKIRIYEEYCKNPFEKDFVRFLSKEYGTGGFGGPDGIDEMHDGKGIRFSKTNKATGEKEVEVSLKWEQAAIKIADLIDEDNYLNDEERQEYATLVRFREERSTAKSDDELVKIIARQIVEYGTSHTYCEKYSEYPDYLGESMQFYTQRYETVNEEIAKFDEVKSVGNGNIYPYSSPSILFKLPYCPKWQEREERMRQKDERIKEYADRFTRKCADEYRQTNDKNVVLTVTPNDISEREYLFLKDERDEFIKYFLKQKGVQDVNLSMQKIEITFDRRYIESLIAGKEQTPEERGKIRKIANGIIADGIKESTEGNYITFFEDFNSDKDFVIAHKKEIVEELCLREEVSDVEMTDDCFDVNYYTDCLWNYKDEEKSDLPIRDLDAEDDEEWKRRIASGEIKPIERTSEATKESNTDLTEIGFEQSELGGAKQRFKNNIEAVKLVNRLVISQKEATDEEKKVLAKYVGWGGLAQAFDEHNLAWSKEYAELKNVLTDEEYVAAKGSVLNAHYTSKTVIDGIYNALVRFGVKGNNRILEPALGTGNFFGFMPKEISDNAKLYGVELDKITGKIATKLYPQAKIQIKGFEETAFADNSFDLMVTNVPFGGYTVFDPDYNKHNFYIHDYFLAKGIDKVKPNGLMAVITSKGTMDKQNPSIRKYLVDRAELVGAIRLPNTAFKQTANTEVVTDILFFRKRQEKINASIENTEWLSIGKTSDGYEINNYYVRHPEMVLGTLAKETGLYGAEDITVKPDGRDLSEALNEAISRLPQGFYVNPEYLAEEESKETIEVDYDVKPMNLTAVNGKLYMRVGENMVGQTVPPFPKDAYQRIAEMIAIRKQLRKVLDIQVDGCSDEVLQKEQLRLGLAYDAFVKKYGYINSKNNLRLFKADGDSALLFACENVSEDEATVTKADVFTKRTIRPYTAVTSTDDCFEALQISKNERGTVDISFIEELTKKDYDTVLSELGNAVFRNPVAVNPDDKYSGFETAEEYLSGRVVDKLQTAERMKVNSPDLIDYDKNISALQEVQPAPIKASDIAVRIGTSWIDKEYYKQFFCELIGLPFYYRDGLELYYNKHDSSWRIDRTQYVRNFGGMNISSVYGTSRANAYRLFEDCLNQKSTQIFDTVVDADGREKRVLNNSETVAAREKQNKIKEAFKDWIFKDPARRDELETIYNRLFNQIRLPKYDGSYLRFPEMNPAIELRPHQKDAVHRIITSGNTLLHHIVGSGKTYTICAAAMKLRQYGLAKKPMIAVPNHLVQQWANSFRELYPTAKLLIATKDDLDKDHREQFVSKVAMGDWDAVIIAQSSFAKINISPERQIAKIREEIQAIEDSISMRWEDSNSPSGSVKNLERIKKGRETQLKKLLDETKKDNVLIFEKLGVDYLFVDEADAYKNLFLYTKMNNVAGISNAASARASDLQLKIEYINELHGGDKGVVFATGTPISNSMTEMYTMQTYLQKQTLEQLGITYFDAWAADFGETVTALELAPSGKGYRARTRFAKFTNLPELLTLYHSFADVKTDVKLDVPEAERKVITLKPTDAVIDLTEEIAERADRIYGGGIDPHIDNMLKVTGDGKKLALDPRCIDPTLQDEATSKLNYCAENVYEEWKNSAEIKGTQLVFCDLSTPKKAYSEYEYGKDFDVYNDLKHKLVERGIPEEQIVFIHDANTDKQKQDLFDKVTAGTVRVLIGSTEKCGAGTNVQKRLVALHHLDAPYRPRDFTQRDGRGIRQGNMNKSIRIYTYATERTFDSYSYQILENKQRFISQIEKGDMTVREADDIDEATLSYAEIKAITSANPKIKRKMELDMEVARLRDLESRYKKDLFALQDKIRKDFPEQIKRQELYLERVRKDVETIRQNYKPDTFEINVGGTLYSEVSEDGKKNGGLALMDALFNNKTETVVAEYCGLKISLNPMELIANERSITLTGAGQYKMDIGQSASGNLTRLENFVKEFATREERALKRLESTKSDFEVAKEQVKVPFEHKNKIIELNTELSELNAELDLNRREEVVIDDGDEEDNISERNEEIYAALPKKQRKIRTNKKNMLTEKLYQAYKQTEKQNPEAMVFAVKDGDYTCFDNTAEELTVLSSLSPSYFRVGEKEVKTLTIDETLFKEFAETFVNAGLKIALFDEPKEEKTFIDESDKVAAMQVDLLPDYTVSNEQMHEYGYTWDGMLPLRVRTAKLLFDAGADIYKLGKTDSESLVSDGDFDDTDSLYGIEKPEWERFLISDNGKAYLTARSFVVESASRVINDEMDYVDGRYADPLTDRFLEESKAIERTLKSETAPIEKVKEHIMPLIENYQKRFPLDVLYEWYGWDDDSVYTALAENITNEELCEYAKEKVDEKNFDLFIQEKIGEIAWLAGRSYVEDEIEDIVNDLKPDFEDSYFNKSDDDYPFDEWYDDFSEEKIRPYLEERLEKSADESINEQFDVNKELNEEIENISVEEVEELLGADTLPDYTELVRQSVNDEFDEFKASLLTKTPEEVFYNNYEIHIKTELKETIESCDFDTEYFRALYEEVDKGGVLQQLYDDFLDNEYASVSTGSDTEDFIKDYCEHYHSDLMKAFLSDGKGVYFGTDEENKSFYYFKDKLSVDTLYRIKEESDEYVIVAPVCYVSQESLEEKNITFLKLDRDVSESELKINDQIAQFAMQSAYNKKFPMETTMINEHCKSDIEKGIAFHFDGMRLNTDFINNLYALYGEERMNYVLANTVQTLDSDGRFSVSNKEWAKQIIINNDEADRNKFVVQSHPAVFDGFIAAYRKYAQTFKDELDEEDKQTVEEKTKINYVKVKVANDAFIKKSGMGSVFKMPTNGEYSGYAYYVFNDKITSSRQITDLQSDSRELCYELKLREDKTVDLFKGRGDDEELISLSVEEFKKTVDGTTNKDYEMLNNDDTKWFNTSVPSEAFIREYDNSMLFRMPNKQEYEGMTYFIPTVFVGEDKNSDDDRVLIRLPEDFVVKAQNRDGEKKEELTAYDFNRICDNTTAEDYKRRYVENTKETNEGSANEWNYVSVPERSRIATYDDSTLFRMPNGEYKDYTYYIPNKCVKENEEKDTIRLSLHNDYVVCLTDNKGEEKKTTELNAKEFCEYLREKDEYGAEYKRPIEEVKTAFEEREKTLRACVPDEMKARANWVAIKTWWNEEKGRYAKRPIDCNTGEYAESDNPDTWTSFDKALDYAREHGGTTVAYALDGKDRIVCVDLDNCYDGNGELSETAKEVLQKSGITYAERSVSGNGLHVFGKVNAMDLRTFARDGDLEFYQKDQFIAMTGDGAKTKDLMNFDTCEMKPFLEKKCEKREQFIGTGKGVSGLSTMSDKDVVEKASAAKNGEKFKALYSGENLQNNHSNSDMSLMNLLAYWCNGDKEQMLRVFATSGLYRPNKSVDYYEHTAIKAIRDIPQKATYTPTLPKNTGGNGKR